MLHVGTTGPAYASKGERQTATMNAKDLVPDPVTLVAMDETTVVESVALLFTLCVLMHRLSAVSVRPDWRACCGYCYAWQV
jgi:hypothetical protein